MGDVQDEPTEATGDADSPDIGPNEPEQAAQAAQAPPDWTYPTEQLPSMGEPAAAQDPSGSFVFPAPQAQPTPQAQAQAEPQPQPTQVTPWGQPSWPAPTAQQSPWTTGGQPPPPPGSGVRPRTVVTAIITGFLLIALGASIGWVTGRDRGSLSSGGASSGGGGPITQVPQTLPTGQGGAVDASSVAGQVNPAIVDVNTYTTRYGLSSGRLFELGAGTGMIVTSTGQVLTNNHVVKGSNSIRVTIEGRSGTYKADVIGVDPTDDVALLQIEGVSGLPTVTLSDSSSLQVGQSVVAIGNALGKGGAPSVTQGSVTALGRSINVNGESGDSESLSGLIQTDAPISPGDSGGALVNASGQVVGMITAASTFRPNQQVSTIGYAIPVNNAVAVVNKIRSGDEGGGIIIGKAGFLGISVRDVDQSVAAQLGLQVTSGVLVAGLAPGGPAAKAGIPANSVITAVDGEGVQSLTELGTLLHRHSPGEHASITYVDSNGSHTVTVTLTEGPAV